MESTNLINRQVLQEMQQKLSQVMASDWAHLRTALDRMRTQTVELSAAEVTTLHSAIQKSINKRAARAARVPELKLDEALPVTKAADRIVKLIRQHRVVVIAGETGSGKTTQLPKLCLAAGRGVAGMIGCTQPRRIAARSVARRVAQELDTEIGALVGFQVRFSDQVGENTLIKFMTDGILLAETQRDRLLTAYDTIIVDEAHERSLNIDFLLGYLKRLLNQRRDLKILITSATINTQHFSEYFDKAPVVNVEGRSFPVVVHYRSLGIEEISDGADKSERSIRRETSADSIADILDEISVKDAIGDVLVFLPGEREIRDAHDALVRRKFRETEILPLYARLSARDQDRIFNPGLQRRIVLTTNVAETSLTVPRIRYVIDSGQARINRYHHRSKVQRLHIEPISQASAEQRKGRCGRVGPGMCYRMYSEADFNARNAYTDSEILRSSLAGVILRMMSLRLGAIESFPFLEMPSERAINEGYTQLIELGAITQDKRQLTAIGQQLARIALDVKLARMLVAAEKLGALREVTVIAAFLSIQDPRERPLEARAAADAAHAVFADPKSDFTGIQKLWAAYTLAHEELTQSKLRDWCEGHFLSFLRMREWRELHRQLLLQCSELGWELASESASYEAVHRALISGLPGNLGCKGEKSQYHGPRGRRFQLFPGSALAKQPPLWVLSATLLDTQKLYGIINARIDPEWAIEQATHLIKRSYQDPHWNRRRGQVLAFEQISLFGLVLVERRAVHYGSVDKVAARQIFIRSALVPCELDVRSQCIAHNRNILNAARTEEAKQRRHGLLRDESELVAWWEPRLPPDICTGQALDAWTRRISNEQLASLKWSLTDVLQTGSAEADRFPTYFVQDAERFQLSYQFDPGRVDDGVTLHLPLSWLNAISAPKLSWLVPGMLEAKVTELIRSLPKPLRRNFVPAPDFARAFATAETPGDIELSKVLGAYLNRITDIEVPVENWQEAEQALPEHLQFRLRLFDDNQNTIMASRDLLQLRRDFGERARRAFADKTAEKFTQVDVKYFPANVIPTQISTQSGLRAYPALIDRIHRVDLGVFEHEDEALTAHCAGVRRLLRSAVMDKCKQVSKKFPLPTKQALAYASLASPEQLREDIVQGVLDNLLASDSGRARTLEAFQLSEATIDRQLFPLALERLQLVEASITAYIELLPKLHPPLMGFAKASYDDLREQLSKLIFPGFAQRFSNKRLGEIPRYLQAIQLRIERLHNDPRKDQARMLVVHGLQRQLQILSEPELLRQNANMTGFTASAVRAQKIEALRWSIEELRVHLFAQELGTRETISEKRVQRMLDSLRT